MTTGAVADVATVTDRRPPGDAGWSVSPGPELAQRAARLLRRVGLTLLGLVPVAFISTSVCYLLLYLTPANAADRILGENGTPQEIHRLAVALGTNRPFLAQYWAWLKATLHGDLGNSYYTKISVAHSIGQRLPVDVSVAVLAIVLALILGFAGGIAAARHRGGLTDRAVTGVCSVAVAIPEFWLGMLLVLVFAVVFKALPASGYVGPTSNLTRWLSHAILPAFSLSVVPAATIARQLRTALVEVLSENYVIGARVRGLGPRRVLFRHALRNAAGPAVAAFGWYVPNLIGGAIVAETVFGLPGLGQFALEGAQGKDMPVIQGVLIVLIAMVLVTNVFVNALLGWLRPETKV